MKLCKISHYKCDEFDGHTFLLGPDNITEEQLSKDAEEAVNYHLNKLREFNNQPDKPAYPRYPDLDKVDPNTTCGELVEQYKKDQVNYKNWETLRRESSGSFMTVMSSKGYKRLSNYEGEQEITGKILVTTAYWGHNHDLPVNKEDDDLDIL